MKNKHDIADVLNTIAVLMELAGENVFKVKAYQRAAKLLEQMEADIELHILEGTLAQLPGIGVALADKIEELYHTGESTLLIELKANLPDGLVDLLEIQGLGPKKIKILYDTLGVTNIESLEAACNDGTLAELKGFGKKTQDNLLASIVHKQAYSQRHLWSHAHQVAERILAGLRELPQVIQAESAGSLRRKLETIGDLDFLVAAQDIPPIMQWFTTQPDVGEILAHGPTKSSVRFKIGLQADLRVVTPEQFPFAWHYFTGSKDHNIQMRQRALSQGYSLSEWGLKSTKPETASDQLTGLIKTEAELFSFLGAAYIAPEYREGLSELKQALHGSMPELLTASHIKGTFHNHTSASDGHNTLEEMVQAAQELNWEYIGISDHSKSSRQANGLTVERLLSQIEAIEALNRSQRYRPYVFTGTECDILPDGTLDYPDEVLKQLDCVIISVHSHFTMTEALMTDRIIKAIENPYVTMLGHPTGRLLLQREPYAVNMSKVIDAAIANQVMIEINAAPSRMDMDWRLWLRAAERGLMTSINPDAHSTASLEFYKYGVHVACKGQIPHDQVFNTFDLEAVKLFLKHKRELSTSSTHLK